MIENEITRVGIVGDGQLGRMMAEANLSAGLGLEIGVLGIPSPDGRPSPADQIPGVRQFYGESLFDREAIRRIVEWADVTTIEVEHIGAKTLATLDDQGHNIQPSPRSVGIIQNKYRQKIHLQEHGIPVADYLQVTDASGLAEVRALYGASVMVKSAVMAFDGRGNLLVNPDMDWNDVEQKFGTANRDLYAERLVPFERELSLVGVRDYAGSIITYPLVETIHENNICHTVYAPARINPAYVRQATELGIETMRCFEGAGVMAVEMFQTADNELIVNEVAPRVHNSGHWTIEGAVTSQFENHLRAVAGKPIGPTNLRTEYGAAVMINILGTGEKEGELDTGILDSLGSEGLVAVHGYGKTLRKDRKVGHVTGLGFNHHVAEDNAEVTMLRLEGLY